MRNEHLIQDWREAWKAEVARVERLEAALQEAIEEMEDMVSYVPDYFRQKWEHDAAIARAKAALGQPDSDGGSDG